MRTWQLVTGLFAAGSAFAVAAYAEGDGGHQEWDYGAEHGPEHWAGIDPAFASCGIGLRQSPIDIPDDAAADARGDISISFDYADGAASIVDLGHTLQVNPAPGNRLDIAGASYELLQFHFHTPSENTFDGAYCPLEVHLVHRNAEGRLAVVAVMVDAGEAGVLDGLPRPDQKNVPVPLDALLDPTDLLLAERDFLAFDGSLTTPPRSEGVQWVALREATTATEETLAQIAATIGPNNRPTRPLNGRPFLAGD